MLYVPFLAEQKWLKNFNKGTINVLQGGGQRSMVKDHTFTFFVDPSLIVLLSYCLFVFLSFCLFTLCHNHGVHIYYQTNFCYNPTNFQCYHTFYHKPIPLSPPTPHNISVPKRNTGNCFERPAKILRGLWRFGNNWAGGGGGGVLTTWF